MDGSSGNSRHNSIKAHALLRLSVARACDLVRLAACHAFENEADPGRAELRRSQVQLREEWRAAYSGFPSAVPPVGIAGDDSDPHRGQGKQPELLHKAKAPLEMSTDAPASVSLARQLLRSAKSLKGLHEATSMTETSDNSTAQVAANSQAEINLIAEIRIAWALIDRTIVAPLEALVDRLDPPEPSSFDVDASTTLPPRLRPAAVLSPPAAPSINLSSTMQLPLRPHVAPGALVAVGAEAVRRRLQLFLMDQHQAQVAVAQAGAVLQRVLRMWCAKRRAAQRALQAKQAGAILARWCEDLWPKHMARTQAAQARRQVAAAKVQRWWVRHWRVAASKRQVVEPSTQLWFVSRVPVAGNAAKQAVAMAGRRLVRLQAFWRGAVARQRFAPSRSSKRLPAQLMGLPGAPSLMSTIPSARSPLAMALEAIGAGNVGAHHGAPSSIQGWVKRQARLQRAWQVDEALVAGRCAQDAGAAAAQAAVAELEAHVASSLQAWTVEMRKVREVHTMKEASKQNEGHIKSAAPLHLG